MHERFAHALVLNSVALVVALAVAAVPGCARPDGADTSSPASLGDADGGASPPDGAEHPSGRKDPDAIDPHDFAALGARLGGDGLEGHLHASVADTSTFVFTFRKKGEFFDYVDLSLVPRNERARAALAGLRRHDRVRLFGEMAELDTPQPHVFVDRVELVEGWTPPRPVPRHDYEVDLPAGLEMPATEIVKVHALDADGKVLVIEYEDRVLPVFVDRPELTAKLWRNDKIKLSFDRAGRPDHPTHLVLDRKVAEPIEVLERMQAGHGEPLTLEGKLVLFPDSPQLMFDIYALQVEDDDGIRRNYTLVNFEDMAVFEAIRQKLADTWGDAPGVEGRNKLIHPTVRIRAKGTKNVVSARQANPQLLLEGPDAITVLER